MITMTLSDGGTTPDDVYQIDDVCLEKFRQAMYAGSGPGMIPLPVYVSAKAMIAGIVKQFAVFPALAMATPAPIADPVPAATMAAAFVTKNATKA